MILRGFNLPEQWKEFLTLEVISLEKPMSIRLKELNILPKTALKYLTQIEDFNKWYDQKYQRVLSTRWAISSKKEDIMSKRKETCLERYGCTNPANAPVQLIKRRNTCFKKYGGPAPAFSKEVREKAKETNLKKYGKLHPLSLSKDQIKARLLSRGVIPLEEIESCATFIPHKAKCAYCGKKFEFHFNSNASGFTACPFCDTNSTVLEHNLSEFIQSLGYKVVPHFRNAFKNTVYAGKEIDIYIPSLKIGFEINGAYSHNSDWHPYSNPKENNYHLLKTEAAHLNGITLYHIWEHWDETIIRSIIRTKLKKSTKINARSLEFKEISLEEVSTFIKSSHIHGIFPQSVIFALMKDNVIFQIMSFRKTKIEGQIEISRLCSKLNTVIVGGASKLLKHAIPILKERFQTSQIISFAYRDLSPINNTVYDSLGFMFSGFTKPSMSFYVRSAIKTPSGDVIRPGIYSRQYFQTHLMISKYGYPSTFKESDLKEIGAFKVFDSGNLSYTLDI